MRNNYIYDYWCKYEIGDRMIASENVSESDLLFLIPNNKKKMHGLPMTRIPEKRKRRCKRNKIRQIRLFNLFDIYCEILEKRLQEKWKKDYFFTEFVDVKNLSVGDRNVYSNTTI